jgi:hypothetical protein
MDRKELLWKRLIGANVAAAKRKLDSMPFIRLVALALAVRLLFVR